MTEEEKVNQLSELVFIYNARSGVFNKLTDFGHKLISPRTYACNLCSLTHGTFEMQQEWKEFIKGLPYPVSFQYKDRSKDLKKYGEAPLLLLKQGEKASILLSVGEINAISSLSELIEAINIKVKGGCKMF